MTMKELTAKYSSGELSPTEYVRQCIDRIDACEEYRYFVFVNREKAIAAAEESAARYRAGQPLSPLDGVPYGVKDLIDTKDMPTTQGSAIYQGYMASEDAEVIRRLDAAGAIDLGKLNMQEFAFGAAGDRSYGGFARNPYDFERVCGGSSSGPAGAVAKELVQFSLTTDTGGSGRIPASLCGVVGSKFTHGRISIRGVKPVCEELDHVGVMTANVEDNALVLNVLAGYDPDDIFSKDVPAKEDYSALIGGSLKGIRAGIPYNYYRDNCKKGVFDAAESCIGLLRKLGGEAFALDFPEDFDRFRPRHQTLLLANAYRNHLDDVRDHLNEMDPGIIDRLLSGNISAAEYQDALHGQEEFRRYFAALMSGCDCLLMPTTPDTACMPFTSELTINGNVQPTAAVYTHYTWFSNYTGFPCISLPAGFVGGLPAGLQIIGKPWEEDKLCMIAAALENAMDWRKNEW